MTPLGALIRRFLTRDFPVERLVSRGRGSPGWATGGNAQGLTQIPVGNARLAHYALTAAAIDNARQISAQHLHAALEELRP